jgi:hypothetical protein
MGKKAADRSKFGEIQEYIISDYVSLEIAADGVSTKSVCAAQYVRMSTEYEKYFTENYPY